MKNQLSIRLHGAPIGVLEQTPSGKMLFSYDSSATQAISMAMPIREKPYGHISSEAYFGGLLPESEVAKKILGQKYGVSSRNPFALLKVIGHDCAGAISCHAITDPVDTQRSHVSAAKVISQEELYKRIKALPRAPLFMEVDGLRLSLAGVQDKAAVCLVDNNIALAMDGCPTTHILKPSSEHFEAIAENEYFCLRLARRIGLPIPMIELRKCQNITFLLIERYDRRIVNDGVERIHQEDFCQALGVLSSKKYQNEGGPGFKECFNLLKETVQPAKDRNCLASALVFNYLIGNMDAHGKNFSLLHYAQDNICLAPFYDILCTRAYEGLTSKMAMKIGGEYDADRLRSKHWQQLCQDIGYGVSAIRELIQQQAAAILAVIPEEREHLLALGGNAVMLSLIITKIEYQVKQALDKF